MASLVLTGNVGFGWQQRTPWEGIGVSKAGSENQLTIDEIVKRVPRFAEKPVLKPIYVRTQDNKLEKYDNAKAIVFESDEFVSGLATRRYVPVSYVEAFKRVFGWVDTVGAWVTSASILDNGRYAFIVARTPTLDFDIGDGDRHELFLTVFAGSDGRTGITPYVTPIRTVCANAVALGISRGTAFFIRHVASVYRRLEEAARALNEIEGVRNAYIEACNRMLTRKVSESQMLRLLDVIVPGDSAKTVSRRMDIADAARRSENWRGYTAYSLFQGITDYVDHDAVKSSKVVSLAERRFTYAMMGAGSDLKLRALRVLGGKDEEFEAALAA